LTPGDYLAGCLSSSDLLAVEQQGLASLLRSAPEIGAAINSYISQNLIQKLIRQNQTKIMA